MPADEKQEGAVYSIIVPLYKAEAYLSALMEALESLRRRLNGSMETVLVLDGPTGHALTDLESVLTSASFSSTLVVHSRNFGSLAAIRSGLAHATGHYFATMSADLQEPPELLLEIFNHLSKDEADLAMGQRTTRNDPFFSRCLSSFFWAFYRRFVQPDIPPGGVDTFGCNRVFRSRLLDLYESHNVLLGTLFWIGFRRVLIPYERRPNRAGKSTWTLRRKIRYAADNVFLYSDFPIHLITFLGLVATVLSLFGGLYLFCTHAPHTNSLRYAPEILIAMFLGGINALGFGILGGYLWRILVSSRRWPQAVMIDVRSYAGTSQRANP